MRFKQREYGDPGKLFYAAICSDSAITIPLGPSKVLTVPAKSEGTRTPVFTTETYLGMRYGLGLRGLSIIRLLISEHFRAQSHWKLLVGRRSKASCCESRAVQGNYTTSHSSQACRWQQPIKGRHTLLRVTGNCLCLGKHGQSHLCDLTQYLVGAGFLI